MYVPPIGPTVTGRESWSRVYCLSPSMSAYEPMLQNFYESIIASWALGSIFQADYKTSIRLWWEQFINSAMFLFCLLCRVPLVLLNPPWSNSLLWGSWVVRKILIHKVIVSLILAPCRARGSATTVRRILMTSLEFSHHDRRAVLVFARVKMCWHLSLVHSSNAHRGKPQISFPRFPNHREIGWIYGQQAAFSLP